MSKKDDAEHFLRFSMIAIFLVASLAVLGMAALVMDGPPALELTGNVVGAAVEEPAEPVQKVPVDRNGDGRADALVHPDELPIR